MKDLTGFPRGWFAVAWAGELGSDEPMSLNYFDKHMVLWRDAGGVARCIDAYCPHLGAHLGIGGKVVEGVRLVNFVIRADMTAPVEESEKKS